MQIFQQIQTSISATNRLLLLCLMSAAVGCPVLAQSDFVSFGHLTTEHGLSQDFVNSIAQDRDPKTGVIWIGTEKGVEYYDPNGIQFGRAFLPEPDNQDQFYSVSAMMPDPDQPDRYWLSVWAVGLFEWERSKGTFKHYRDDP